VLVPGDVNSTLAAALVTVKLRRGDGRTRLAHLEAGLRSHDWRMPEEVNRVLTDRCSDLLLTPSRDAHAHLAAEGIAEDRVRFVGNVMIDTLLSPRRARAWTCRAATASARRLRAATLHRPSNVDAEPRLRVCLEALAMIAERMPVVLPLHPRTRQRAESFGLGALLARLTAAGAAGLHRDAVPHRRRRGRAHGLRRAAGGDHGAGRAVRDAAGADGAAGHGRRGHEPAGAVAAEPG
jgi:UDP-N-acetylglucosamine 2-epimerase (non-hydrolysing)